MAKANMSKKNATIKRKWKITKNGVTRYSNVEFELNLQGKQYVYLYLWTKKNGTKFHIFMYTTIQKIRMRMGMDYVG